MSDDDSNGFNDDLENEVGANGKSSPSSDISAITVSSTDSSIETSASEKKLNFQYCSYIKEKRMKKLWSVEFNHYLKPEEPKIFAALGGTQFSIYECTPNGKIELKMCCEDANEDFYTCCWSVSEKKNRSILVTAGKCGIIRIFHFGSELINAGHLIGHGQAVNQLKISPRQLFLLASASSDYSIRLWNIETKVCIATLHGVNGHRDQVVTVDFNRDGSKLVSGGHDHMLAIWDITIPEITSTIEKSRHYKENDSSRPIKTVLHSFPIFRTRMLHSNYIDCVQWLNDHILSKSCEDDFFCWVPGSLSHNKDIVKISEDQFTTLTKFDISECGYFFIRFTISPDRSTLALGNTLGHVRVWNLDVSDPENIPSITLSHQKCKAIVRHLSFSRCGRELVFCCEDGTIWHYQRKI